MPTTTRLSHQQRLEEIAALAPTRDWRYFTFYMGVVQTLGRSTAGETIRRLAAADEDAATYSTEAANAIRDTYVGMLPVHFADGSDVDKARAVLHVHQALLRCPVQS